MSWAIGERIICIDDIRPPDRDLMEMLPNFVMENQTYTIRKIFKSNWRPGFAFLLHEIHNPIIAGLEVGFNESRFRKYEEFKENISIGKQNEVLV